MRNYMPLLIVLAFALAAAMPARAAECQDTALSLPKATFSVGEQFVLTVKGPAYFNSSIGPEDPQWGSYQNVTLSVSPGLSNLTSPLFADVVSATNPSRDWTFNATSTGTQTVTATMSAADSTCDKNISLPVADAAAPNITMSVSDMTEIAANITYQFTVTLNNIGNANATNVHVNLDAGPNSAGDMSFDAVTLEAGQSMSKVFSLFTNYCSAVSSITATATYSDANSRPMPSVQKTDSFIVNGSDLTISSLSASPDTVITGQTASISAVVKNIGDKAASGFNVTFYDGSISPSSVISETVSTDAIDPLQNKTVSIQWSTAPKGSHNIIAVAKSPSGDCNFANSQSTSALTVNERSGTGGDADTGGPSNPTNGNPPDVINLPAPTPSPIPVQSQTPSPTPAPEVVTEIQHLGSIMANQAKTASFVNSDKLNVLEVLISVRSNVEGATVIVKNELQKPTSVNSTPDGEVYRYLSISTNIKNGDINSSKVRFKIEKTWLTSSGVDKTKVYLNRFTTQWDKLPTAYLSEDETFAYYVAESPGFSVFAISGEKPSAPAAETPTVAITGLTFLTPSNVAIASALIVALIIAILFYRKQKPDIADDGETPPFPLKTQKKRKAKKRVRRR